MLRLLRFAGPAALALAALVLGVCWQRIPERWVMHWGPGGVPDGWGVRSPVVVFSPLVWGLLVWGGLELMAMLLDRRTEQPELARANATAVRAIGAAVTALFGGLAVILPLVQPTRAIDVVIGSLLWTLGIASVALAHVMRTARRLLASGELRAPKGWNGVIYSNREDPRIFVPKLAGIGYTLNFGNPRAWLVLVAMLLPLVLLMIAGLRAAH